MRYQQQERSRYELQKLADFWLDLAKLILLSFVIKLLEPGQITVDWTSVITILIGLTTSVSCARIGLKFARQVLI
ncbi:MAG: hypothetical protein HY381_01860 [Candidatus Chisholmbacteria bacterium]|nr:hypothetical protein [Candidatus Chisholmbacteria bacterium]